MPSPTTPAGSTPPATTRGRCWSRPRSLTRPSSSCPLELVAGLQVAIANVALVAQRGRRRGCRPSSCPRASASPLRELPVGSAAVYVPGGRAPYPSTVVMGVVTARAAGVVEVAVCSPPGVDGQIDPAILGVCRLCGVERVYRMGGAQAIAALAYGTDTVARVDVVVGPGNLYVQEAKRLVSAAVGIDGFAGPSDLLVLLGRRRASTNSSWRRSTCSPRASTARAASWWRSAPARAGAMSSPPCSSASSSSAPPSARRCSRSCRPPTRSRRWRSRTPSHPSTCS